jgi:tRNA pseudouridine38-40 synthase
MSEKFRYKLIIAYDGTAYCGWQVQNTGISIQALIQQGLETALRVPTDLSGSGRTDAGVHAQGQVAHFDTATFIDPKKLFFSLNSLLPSDIRILSLESIPKTFHARYSAKEKTYHYHLHLNPVADPILFPYRYHAFGQIDLNKLAEGIKQFLGTHDFTSFANDATRGSAAHDPIRTLTKFELVEQPGGIRLELTGDGFLYKMVRNIVGTLLDVARGKMLPEQIPTILEAKDRRLAGQAAPPHALFLMHVAY